MTSNEQATTNAPRNGAAHSHGSPDISRAPDALEAGDVAMVFPGPVPPVPASQRRIQYHDGIRSPRVIHDTPLAEVCRKVSDVQPVAAGVLEDFNDNVVAHMSRQYEALETRLDKAQAKRNSRVRKHNRKIRSKIEAVVSARDKVLVEKDAELQKLEPRLLESELTAAAIAGRAGLSYDGKKGEAIRPEVKPDSLEVLAGLTNVPYDRTDEQRGSMGLQDWVLTTLTGSALGLSGGLISGLLDAGMIAEQVPQALLWAMLGVGVCAYLKQTLHALWSIYGGFDPEDCSKRYQRAWQVASVVTLMALGVNTLIDSQGILSARDLNTLIASLSPGATASFSRGGSILFLFAGMMSAFPFIIGSAVSGYRWGRHTVNRNHLLARQAALHQKEALDLQADQSRQDALIADNLVRVLRTDRADLLTSIQRFQREADEKIARLEAGLKPLEEERSEADSARLDYAYREALGSQSDFRELLACLGDSVEPSTFWFLLSKAGKGRSGWWVFNHLTRARTNSERMVRGLLLLIVALLILVLIVAFARSR